MMTRTQIMLDPRIQREAKRRASEMGISLAEYIRRLVARDLERPAKSSDPSVVFDLGDSGGADVAREKDEMIGRAFADRGTS